MRRWQSPETGNLGNGQKRAATELGSTLVGHLKPTTAASSSPRSFNVRILVAKRLTLGIAVVQQLVRPVASVDALVVGQAGVTVLLVGFAVGALDVRGGAVLGDGVQTELVLAARRGDGSGWKEGGGLDYPKQLSTSRLTIPLATLAVHRPVVVAVVVHRALAVEEQPVLAGLQGQGAVGAEEELVAVLRVGVGLDAVLLGALGCAHGQGMSCKWSQG